MEGDTLIRVIAKLPDGIWVYARPNEVGGHTVYTDHIGGGAPIATGDTALDDPRYLAWYVENFYNIATLYDNAKETL